MHITLAGILALIISGTVFVGLIQNKPQLMATAYDATPVAVPTAFAGFPDIESVPIHANVAAVLTKKASNHLRNISYETGDNVDKVREFYEEMLPRKGWLLRSRYGQSSMYSWTNPAEKPLWHMYLKVTIGLNLDDSRTLVNLEYGRYPSVEGDFALYPDAQQATVTRSNIEKSFPDVPGLPDRKVPARVTETTYLSSASPQDVANFCTDTNTMSESGWSLSEPGWSKVEYPWFFFERPGSQEVTSPADDTISNEGLYFVAGRPGWENQSPYVSYHLLIIAKVQDDGTTIVKLHLEEIEAPSEW